MSETYPEKDELVVIKLTKVLAYGAFASLEEYQRLAGFIHISQVASSWVKNIRNHVKENQIKVAQVLAVDPEKKQVDLSLTKVSDSLQKQKLEEWKQSKRAAKLLGFLAKQKKVKEDAVMNDVGLQLEEKYGTVMDGLRAYLTEGEKAFDCLPEKWAKPLGKLVEENIKLQEKNIKGEMKISSAKGNGADAIRDALVSAMKKTGKNIRIWYE